jgi:hypothetical protein
MAKADRFQSQMPRADFLTGIVFFLLGIYMIAEGAGMPGPAEVSFIEVGGEPGRVPIVVGSVIASFAFILLIRSVGDGGHKVWQLGGISSEMRTGTMRSAIAAIGCTAYALGLLGARIGGWHIPYEFATGIFVFLFIVGFDWQDAREYGAYRWSRVARRWPDFARNLRSGAGEGLIASAPYLWLIATALLLAVIVSAAVTYLFEQEFYVTLP